MRDIASLAELKSLIGQEVAVSDWVEIIQERVNQFAEATGDRQWIHLDVERARKESPFGGTIAHGFLTLSMLPILMESVITMSDVKMAVNYGLNKVRFPAPVLVGSRIRQLREAARLTQEELATAAGIGRVTLVRIENGQQSPRYETLVALAGALGRPVAELLASEPAA